MNAKVLYVRDVEAAFEEHYQRIQIPEHTIAALRNFITAQFSQLHAERPKLLQAHYAGALPLGRESDCSGTQVESEREGFPCQPGGSVVSEPGHRGLA